MLTQCQLPQTLSWYDAGVSKAEDEAAQQASLEFATESAGIAEQLSKVRCACPCYILCIHIHLVSQAHAARPVALMHLSGYSRLSCEDWRR